MQDQDSTINIALLDKIDNLKKNNSNLLKKLKETEATLSGKRSKIDI